MPDSSPLQAPPWRIRRSRRRASVVLSLLLLLCASAAPAVAQLPETEYEGAAALGLTLRQLGTAKRVLMIAAHPDDETTQVLSTLALGEGARVAYLSLTRGEGGQNGIGPELQEALGLIRSEELLAARRLDGAGQYFSRAYDWGFSKNAEEAFRHWPRDTVLADVVAVVRHFRPDVIVSVFGGTPRDGHGQHQAAGLLASDAFDAAGDPDRFPEQLAAGLRPHSPVSLYQLVRGEEEGPVLRMATGSYDPLLGASHFQVAMASRSRHRSQDMGRLLAPGPQETALTLARTSAGADELPPHSLFTAVDTTLSARALSLLEVVAPSAAERSWALLDRYEAYVAAARQAFNPLAPAALLPHLSSAASVLDASIAAAAEVGADELRFHLDAERERLVEAFRLAAGIQFDAIAEVETVVPGQTFALEVTVWNGGSEEIAVGRLAPELPAGWRATPRDPLPDVVPPGTLVTRRFEVVVPPDAAPTEPYFLRQPRPGDHYAWPPEAGPVGFAFEADPVRALGEVAVREISLPLETDATYRGLELRSGEFRRPVRVVPAVSITVEPQLSVLPVARAGEPLEVTVRVAANEPTGIAGALTIAAPPGWSVAPDRIPLRFDGAGEERLVEFLVRAPADVGEDRVRLPVIFEDDAGRRFERGYQLVDYPHIRPRPLYSDAATIVQPVDVVVPRGMRVGYVAGPGDGGPRALRQLGVEVELLDAEALATMPLDGFDVIVVGIRAYEVRPDLVASNHRLLEYVRGGGAMVVQYNQYAYTEPGIAPYPVSMARPHDRVTDHTAAVRLLDESHPVLARPNTIGPADFEGWVQERGLYFLNTWDDRYQPLLEMADPGEAPVRGALLVTRYGEGTYVYTGLALFRQLPAGVPGAYRLFANLLALGVSE